MVMLKRSIACLTFALIALFLVTHVSMCAPQLAIIVQTEKIHYHYRQLVNIYGNVTYLDQLVEEGLVAIQITFPSGLEGHNATRTVPAHATPVDNWEVEIVSFRTTDQDGNPQTSFVKGGNAWFEMTIQNNMPLQERTVLYVLTLYDCDSTPFKSRWVRMTIPGGGNFTERAMIDLNAWTNIGGNWLPTGAAFAYANIYTNWPSMGGSPYSPEQSAVFTITTTSLQTTTSNTQAATTAAPTVGNYNSYQVAIRLPPIIPLGTYTVTASAYYNGLRGSYTTATFDRDYELRGDIVYNRKLDIFDMVAVASAYGTKGGVPRWNPEADLDVNAKVDVFDLVIAAGRYGETY